MALVGFHSHHLSGRQGGPGLYRFLIERQEAY
jgi:hypothetical protein